jgi:hypothetical protein
MPILIGGMVIAGLVALGYSADKVGEGINDTGTGALKIAAVAGVGFYIAKKQGWL